MYDHANSLCSNILSMNEKYVGPTGPRVCVCGGGESTISTSCKRHKKAMKMRQITRDMQEQC